MWIEATVERKWRTKINGSYVQARRVQTFIANNWKFVFSRTCDILLMTIDIIVLLDAKEPTISEYSIHVHIYICGIYSLFDLAYMNDERYVWV